jgi:hypothetical protein
VFTGNVSWRQMKHFVLVAGMQWPWTGHHLKKQTACPI